MGRLREVNVGDPPHLHRKGETWYHVTGTRPRKWTALGRDKETAAQRCEAIERDRMEALHVFVEELAHRTCTRYGHDPDPKKRTYTFERHTLLDFVYKLLRKVGEQ